MAWTNPPHPPPPLDLEILATLPAYQRQGIGKQLLRHGLLEAEKRDLLAWLEASVNGYPLYRSVGFEDVVDLQMDLSKYGSKGIVKTVCMMRPVPK
jgi:ribosomal protein S18 acetylase RimI-like enzyme